MFPVTQRDPYLIEETWPSQGWERRLGAEMKTWGERREDMYTSYLLLWNKLPQNLQWLKTIHTYRFYGSIIWMWLYSESFSRLQSRCRMGLQLCQGSTPKLSREVIGRIQILMGCWASDLSFFLGSELRRLHLFLFSFWMSPFISQYYMFSRPRSAS